ncbi:hypothetical protein CBS101457_002932 [Exobasidium rhododendri]|nr:hypothetical protein CBS101457_002932 [Exobasidium rhododendri]
MVETLLLSKLAYWWGGEQYLVYVVDGRDGQSYFPQAKYFYILHPQKNKALALAEAAGRWLNELHEEVWMFDSGYWQKSTELYNSIRSASWENVILDDKMKKALIDDHLSFFSSREQYVKFKVPWKRGIIYHGPPGNGKTISIKAMMHTLYSLKEPVPTLYVRSLSSSAGNEYSIKQIFIKARLMAPCYLIFEDLDSLITDNVRSYFLNEVDGLQSNDGIYMLGSTNHLERLDPGISKRPSRFDRKFLFSNPIKKERVQYCHFWQRKLQDSKEIDFPDVLCEAIAGITEKFSFAYMQEAFVAALLAIAREQRKESDDVDRVGSDWVRLQTEDDDDDGDDELDKYILWTHIKEQVATLREGLSNLVEEAS